MKSYPFISLLFIFLPLHLEAQMLQFFETFSNGAVLQRDCEHPVWGWASPKASVTVTFAGEQLRAKADDSGRWEVQLPAQKAGGPHVLTVSSKKEQLTLSGLYFGDVYLLSGQSNMEWRLRQSDPDNSRAASISDTLIRELRVKKTFARFPDQRLELEYDWLPGTAENIREFSAVGSYFAHHIRQEVDVPIGLLHSSWGGSRIEAWMSAHLLGMEEGAALADASKQNVRSQPAYRKYVEDFGAETPPEKDNGEALGYLDPATDISLWPTMELPGIWESKGYPAVNGHFYYARYFD
ncbi:MAG: sialate O-acetylesterase, partial [Bacteroidota bacterium]